MPVCVCVCVLGLSYENEARQIVSLTTYAPDSDFVISHPPMAWVGYSAAGTLPGFWLELARLKLRR